MEQIAKLLFATTLLAIFSYLLIYSSIGQAGNGGEYWGYDGYVEPFVVAGRSFDAGDYRFLAFDLEGPQGNRMKDTPSVSSCDNHPFGTENISRPSLIEARHGDDSVRLATEFAYSFNNTMASLMKNELNIGCQKYVYE